MKKAIIIGATSGLGLETARLLARQGWQVALAGRREERLQQLKAEFPPHTCVQRLDVTADDASRQLHLLIEKAGGMDLFLLCAGIGRQNPDLQPETELATAQTNVMGFVRMTTAAFNYFRQQGGGHIAVISSIAGTKGLGAAPAYSATKRFQNTYIEALEQLAGMQHLPIRFTDIRPGFADTDLLKGKHYPLLMPPERVARHIVQAIERRKHVAVIDWRYRLIVFCWRLIPRMLWRRMPVKN